MKKLILIVCLLALWTNIALAADLRGLKDLFRRSFWTSMYQENYCGQNIERFAKAAAKEGINLDNSYVVQIVNAGFDTFGLVNALSVREEGRKFDPAPKHPPYRDIGYNNWNFHVVLIADGEVFDFDFMNQATVYKLPKYLDIQFIPEARRTDAKYKKDKIGPYRLSIYPTYKYLEYLERKVSMKEIRTELYLRDYLPSYFKP
jgi:hypothetical protein